MLSLRGYSHPSPSLHPSSPLSSSFKSSLPLPKVLRQNRSFANLTKFLGIAAGDEYRDGDQSPEGEDDDTGEIEEDAPDAIDEESLMWDAQVSALVFRFSSPAAVTLITSAVDRADRPPTSSRYQVLQPRCAASAPFRPRLSGSRQPPRTWVLTPAI